MKVKLLAPYFDVYEGQKTEWERFSRALSEHAIEYTPWQADEGDLPEYDAIFWQGISGYHKRMDRIAELLTQAELRNVPSLNTPSLIRWNSDKRYVQQLEQADVPTLPTLWLKEYDGETIRQWAKERRYQEIVVKPVISAGAYLTFRVDCRQEDQWKLVDKAYQSSDSRRVMIQPFAPEILNDGEYSFLFFGGAFSHAVRKTPKKGDYRIQHVHGGRYERISPEESWLDQAKKVIAALPEAANYARVDGIKRDGKLLLMEVELIEPYFYLSAAPEQITMFAQMVVDTLQNQKETRCA